MSDGFAGYDIWKTTPPDWWFGADPTPEEEAAEWFYEWSCYTDDCGYEESLEAEMRAATEREAPAGNRPTVWEPAQL